MEGKVINYCNSYQTWNGVFDLAMVSFYENESVEKSSFSIDRLITIPMSYFHIAAYSEERGFAFHFVCGSNPVRFKYENKTSLLICDFCQEALKNPKMLKAHNETTKEIGDAIKTEYKTIDNFQLIKQTYEPKFHGLLKKQKVLKEFLIAYSEKRKGIEPFILEY